MADEYVHKISSKYLQKWLRYDIKHVKKSPPWPSGLKRWNQTLVPVVRARFEPRCGRPHFAPTCSGVRVCGRNRTEAREREWAEGTVSSLPGTLNVRIKYPAIDTGIARSRVVGSGPAQQAMLSEGSDPGNPPKQTFEQKLKKKQALFTSFRDFTEIFRNFIF